MKRLLNKVITITGATKGIGRGIALDLAREGAQIVIGGRSKNEGESLVTEIQKEYGLEALFVQGDVKEEAYCNELIKKTVENFGRIDGLVNNAGIFPEVDFFECDSTLFDQVYAVNVRGAFMCSKFAAIKMVAQGGGSIVQIGSTHAFGASPHYSIYGTSKGELFSLSSYLAKNLAKRHIRSNWITVGWVLTPGELERITAKGHDLAWLEDIANQMIPLGGMQSCEDISYGVIYLLSDESRHVTDTDIKITGGFVPGH